MGFIATVELVFSEREAALIKEFNINIPKVCVHAVAEELSDKYALKMAADINEREQIARLKEELERVKEEMSVAARPIIKMTFHKDRG